MTSSTQLGVAFSSDNRSVPIWDVAIGVTSLVLSGPWDIRLRSFPTAARSFRFGCVNLMRQPPLLTQ